MITGNVSTEESRNEIRNSPGAPSPPANATIFSFHPLNPIAKKFLHLVAISGVFASAAASAELVKAGL